MAFVPEHPGKELSRIISKRGMNLTQFARSINVSSSRISEIVSGKRGVTVDSAIRIAEALDTLPKYWLSKQNDFDLFQRGIALG